VIALLLLLACGSPAAPAPPPPAAPSASVQAAAADAAALGRLQIPGPGAGRRYLVRYQLSFPTALAADAAALALSSRGLATEGSPSESETWELEAREEVALDAEGLRARRAELEALALGYGGSFEGWRAEGG